MPAFVAFQPQISYESSMLNNDIMAIAFTSVVLYLVVVGIKKRFPIWNWRGCLERSTAWRCSPKTHRSRRASSLASR